ncbi:MAG: signal peptidase II [Chloroflexota bacterium]|nr:signal peptidase II [Chloroflexota bacterium]
MKRVDWFFVLAAGLVLVADQATKFAVRAYLAPGQSIPGEGLVRLTHVMNRGASFGLFANQTIPLIITGAIGVLALLLYYRYLPTQNLLLKGGLGLELGGAAGNLIDRISLGYVTDFIDLAVWPVFNVADSAITVGVALLLYYFLFHSREKGKAPVPDKP